MPRAVLLRCPICNAVQALEGQRRRHSKDDLYATAKTHLPEHDLDEPKAAIRKYGMASDAVEVVVSSENQARLPIGEWKTRDSTWLPEGAVPRDNTSTGPSESLVETASVHSHAEE